MAKAKTFFLLNNNLIHHYVYAFDMCLMLRVKPQRNFVKRFAKIRHYGLAVSCWTKEILFLIYLLLQQKNYWIFIDSTKKAFINPFTKLKMKFLALFKLVKYNFKPMSVCRHHYSQSRLKNALHSQSIYFF